MIEQELLVNIVGTQNVINKQAILDQYASDMSFVSAIKPECIVKPKNRDDIEKIVKLARKTGTPLIPVSSGPPRFRGDTVPSVGGAIIIDLSGMKKIIRVDRLNRVAMFEPGVTFGELIPAVTTEKLRLNIPLLPRSTKSVTGSMLEREPVVLPTYHWDIADPLDCVEIIFGTGDMFRTGAAAGPGTLEEQWAAGGAQVEAAGPSSASWYRIIGGSQGTMGVVTWSSARCEILPRLEEPFLVSSSQLDGIMEMVHWLIRLRIPNECFILNKMSLVAMIAKKWPYEYQEIKASLPDWILFYNLAGYEYFPEERISTHEKDVWEITQRVSLEPARSAGKVSAFDLLKVVQAPSAEPYWKLRYKSACQDVFFITNFQKVGELIDYMYKAADDAGYPVPDLGIYIQPLVQGSNYHVEFNLFYNPESQQEANRVKELAAGVIRPLISRGAFFSRPYGENARDILNKDAATVQALKKVKMMLDPDNVMNPGKLCF
ncbi:MAG: FAD-binding oxidoreductase [Dehalococcoidales bacterium]